MSAANPAPAPQYSGTLPPIPPTPDPAPGPYRAVPTPAEEQQIRLLAHAAARNHRSLPPSHPARHASRHLSELLYVLLQRGVPAQALAQLFTPPISHQAVRLRARRPANTPSSSTPAQALAPAPSEHRRPGIPHGTSLITTAPYRRVRLIAPPYPIPPAPLPTFYPATPATSQQFLDWLSSPQRAPGAIYADNGLIRLHLVPVTPADADTEKKEPQ